MKLLRLTASLLIFAAGISANAAESDSLTLRPVTSYYTVNLGSASVTDTYLSPIKYDGWNVGFTYRRYQAMKFNPLKWVMQLRIGAEFQSMQNPAGNSTMLYAGINAAWNMMHRWRPLNGLSIGVGPEIALDLGCLYLSRNGNNPASAKAEITVGATAFASYSFNIGRIPVTLRYQPSLPITGAFFSPDYGELYYEIYLGNHNNLAHCAWWGNYFAMSNYLTADIRFGATWLTVGYQNDILSTKVNNLVTQKSTNSFVIGVSGEWISLDTRKKLSENTRIISATY